jgi:caffeoyl-CoA O-methyltransferase/O-methyltransferase
VSNNEDYATRGIGYPDKLIPNQPYLTDLYRGQNFERDLFQLVCKTSGIDTLLDLEGDSQWPTETMSSNPAVLRFLQFLIRATGAKSVLEIGCFIGVSTIRLAQAVRADGFVTAVEKFDRFAAIAERNFKKHGVDQRINLVRGDAGEILPTWAGKKQFDLIFVDGNKERYWDYVVMAMDILSPRGIIAVDDCFYLGDVLNPKRETEKGEGVLKFLDGASALKGWTRIALPISNGLYLMVRE